MSKPDRNDPCHCGSEKKYKKCCLPEEQAELRYSNQWRELNTYVKTKLAPSEIDGVGVFALRDLKKGETLYADMFGKIYTLPYRLFNKIRPEIVSELLGQFPQIINGSNFMYPTTRVQAFMNHSDDPNYDAEKDILLKDIKKGEEITEDYCKIDGAERVFSFLKCK